MATLYAQSTGNHSEIIWNTASNGSGTNELPTAADTLVSNSYTITIADNLTVVKVTNTGGGTFKLSNGITLTCTDGTASVVGDASDTGAITFDLASPNAATLVAKVLGGNGSKEWGINFSGTGQLTVNGSVTGGSFVGVVATGADGVYMSGAGTLIIANGTSTAIAGGSGQYGRGINNVGAGAITVTGNITAGATGYGYGIVNASTGLITVTGNVSGGISPNGHYAIGINNEGAGSVIVTGKATGGNSPSYQNLHGIANTGNGTVSLTGNVNGGNANNALACGVYNSSNGTILITGSVTAGNNSPGIVNASTGTVSVVGTISVSNSVPGIGLGSASQKTILTGPLIFSSTDQGSAEASGISPITAARWFIKDTAIGTFYMVMRGDAVVDNARPARTLYVAEGVTGDNSALPVPANVRNGISYAVNNALTGTCHVPPAASVLYGVPVDATTGTAEVSGSDPATIAAAVWDHLLADMGTSNSAGARLKQLASTDAVGGIVAALGV